MRYFLLSFIFCLSANVLLAQNSKYYTEEELKVHYSFLEGTNEKLKGNTKKALEIFETILKSDKKNHAAAFEIAKIKLDDDQLDESIRYAKKSVSGDANNEAYKAFLIETLMENNQYDDAIVLLEERKKAQPAERSNYEELAYAYLKIQQSDQALVQLNELEKIKGVEESVVRKKFDIYRAKDDKANAEKELLKLINVYPEDVDYLNILANFYTKTNQPKKSNKTYKKILALQPDHPQANLMMAAELNDDNNASSYLYSLKAVLENPEINIDTKIKELVPHLEDINPKTDSSTVMALGNAIESLRLTHVNSAKALAISGDYYSRIKDDQEAIKYYQRTLEVNDNIFSVWEQLLYTYDEIGDHNALSENSLKAMDLFPNQAIAYILHAKALIALDQKEEARDILSEAKLISGKNQELLNMVEQLSKTIN